MVSGGAISPQEVRKSRNLSSSQRLPNKQLFGHKLDERPPDTDSPSGATPLLVTSMRVRVCLHEVSVSDLKVVLAGAEVSAVQLLSLVEVSEREPVPTVGDWPS